jgi:hypothetical protein
MGRFFEQNQLVVFRPFLQVKQEITTVDGCAAFFGHSEKNFPFQPRIAISLMGKYVRGNR